MNSGDFLTQWNAITVGKGGGGRGKKNNFEVFHIFGYKSFLKMFLVY